MRQVMSTKLIIFDFDGTLGDTRRNIVTTMQMTISEMGLPCRSEQQCASTIGLPLAGCFETLFPDLQPDRIQLCAETYRRLFDENLRAIKPQLFPRVAETLKALLAFACFFVWAHERFGHIGLHIAPDWSRRCGECKTQSRTGS